MHVHDENLAMKHTTLFLCLLAVVGLTQTPAFAMMHATPDSGGNAPPAQERPHAKGEPRSVRVAPPRKADEPIYSVPVRPPQNRAP